MIPPTAVEDNPLELFCGGLLPFGPVGETLASQKEAFRAFGAVHEAQGPLHCTAPGPATYPGPHR